MVHFSSFIRSCRKFAQRLWNEKQTFQGIQRHKAALFPRGEMPVFPHVLPRFPKRRTRLPLGLDRAQEVCDATRPQPHGDSTAAADATVQINALVEQPIRYF